MSISLLPGSLGSEGSLCILGAITVPGMRKEGAVSYILTMTDTICLTVWSLPGLSFGPLGHVCFVF